VHGAFWGPLEFWTRSLEEHVTTCAINTKATGRTPFRGAVQNCANKSQKVRKFAENGVEKRQGGDTHTHICHTHTHTHTHKHSLRKRRWCPLRAALVLCTGFPLSVAFYPPIKMRGIPCNGSSVGRARRCRCRRIPCTCTSVGRARRCNAAFVGSSGKVLAARGGLPVQIDLESIKPYADHASYLNVSFTTLKFICKRLRSSTWSEVRSSLLTTTATHAASAMPGSPSV